MPDRVTALEASLLALDTPRAPGQVVTVGVFDPGPDGFSVDTLIELVTERIAFVPRYRQRVRGVPGRLAAPVWVDDDRFDLGSHVRRAVLPRPGTPEQLHGFVARVLARRLDRSRPLWELCLVGGLSQGRFALVSKTHLALVDGMDSVDLLQVLLDDDPTGPRAPGAPAWEPRPEPSPFELAADAVWENLQDPDVAAGNLRGAVTSALGTARGLAGLAGGAGALPDLAAQAWSGLRTPAGSPLAGAVSAQRGSATVDGSLAGLKAMAAAHQATVHDVLLALVSGGLRSWLLTRGEPVPDSLIALVPISVAEDAGLLTALGSQVVPRVQSLPVGEPDPVRRLRQLRSATQEHRAGGQAVDAGTLAGIPGFAPPTLHALGVRSAYARTAGPYDVLIANVPGPQLPAYAAGSRLVATWPALPLTGGHLVSIGITSYNGRVVLGLTADRDAVSDLDVLVQCLEDAAGELLTD